MSDVQPEVVGAVEWPIGAPAAPQTPATSEAIQPMADTVASSLPQLPIENIGNDGLPALTDPVADAAKEMGLKIVEAKLEGTNLFMVVEGEHIEDVQGGTSRQLAYNARHNYGFSHSGIEPYTGAENVPGTTRYRQTWKFTKGI